MADDASISRTIDGLSELPIDAQLLIALEAFKLAVEDAPFAFQEGHPTYADAVRDISTLLEVAHDTG